MLFDIEEELKKLPSQPGVYIMHDAKDEIIYVGKAISLKNRVRQYFQSSRGKTAKIQQMVSRIARFEYIVTDSELEALVLECNLIKEHQPRYNTMLKDDKAYPYIRVTVGEDFPRVQFARTMKKDRSRYFGPYTSAGAVKDTIDLIQGYRSCSQDRAYINAEDTAKDCQDQDSFFSIFFHISFLSLRKQFRIDLLCQKPHGKCIPSLLLNQFCRCLHHHIQIQSFVSHVLFPSHKLMMLVFIVD